MERSYHIDDYLLECDEMLKEKTKEIIQLRAYIRKIEKENQELKAIIEKAQSKK